MQLHISVYLLQYLLIPLMQSLVNHSFYTSAPSSWRRDPQKLHSLSQILLLQILPSAPTCLQYHRHYYLYFFSHSAAQPEHWNNWKVMALRARAAKGNKKNQIQKPEHINFLHSLRCCRMKEGVEQRKKEKKKKHRGKKNHSAMWAGVLFKCPINFFVLY